MNEEKKRGESVLIEIKTRGGGLFFFFIRALFYSKKKRRRAGGESKERVFFRPHFFLSFDSFLFVSFSNTTTTTNTTWLNNNENKKVYNTFVQPSIDRSLRNDATTPRVVFIVIGFLSQLLDDRIEVTDDVEKRRAFLINRVPHVSHQRHEFFRHQPVV